MSTEHLLSHMIATEACMRALASHLDEDEELWGLTGLVHDIDLDEVQGDPVRHGIVGAGWLEEAGYPADLVAAVRCHAGHGEPETALDRALVAVDPTTGFILAAPLIRPDRKIAGLRVKSIKKRMKEKRFAANVDRDRIRSIESLGVTLDEFLPICLGAMQAVSDEIGL